MDNSSAFFENSDCPYYPCHKGIEHINCLFCYCPLYHLAACPGKPDYVEKNGRLLKRCTDCTFPHKKENYEKIIEILKCQSKIEQHSPDIHGGSDSSSAYLNSSKLPLDFSINTNPLGLPKNLSSKWESLKKAAELYPEPHSETLAKAFSRKLKISEDSLIITNGASEAISLALQIIHPHTALLPVPTFSGYFKPLESINCRIQKLLLKPEDSFTLNKNIFPLLENKPDILILCNPNNPTGLCISKDLLMELFEFCKENGIWILLDESFMSFVSDDKYFSLKEKISEYSRLVIVDCFTKKFCLPGLRLGYALCTDKFFMKKMKELQTEWSVSTIAQKAGLECLEQEIYLESTRKLVRTEREWLLNELKSLGFEVYPSDANFILFRATPELAGHLLERGVVIRKCAGFDCLDESHFRIAVKQHEQNSELISFIKEVCK